MNFKFYIAMNVHTTVFLVMAPYNVVNVGARFRRS